MACGSPSRKREREGGTRARGRLDYSARNVAITNNINSRPGNAKRAASNWAGSKKKRNRNNNSNNCNKNCSNRNMSNIGNIDNDNSNNKCMTKVANRLAAECVACSRPKRQQQLQQQLQLQQQQQ